MTLIFLSAIQLARWALMVVQSMPQTPSTSPRSIASMISRCRDSRGTSFALASNTFL